MKIWSKSFFYQNNKGSAIINVIIAMLFIIALGSALLYTTYIGYSVSVSDRTEKGNFYNAESQMNRILTGLHGFLSDSLVVAYTDTITEYAKGGLSSPQIKFNDNLITKLTTSTVTVNGLSTSLLSITGENLTYSLYALAGFISNSPTKNADGTVQFTIADGSTISMSSDSGAAVTKTFDAKGIGYLTLKGITMSLKSASGYQTTIKTDIKINVPEFLIASASSVEVGDYAIIAENGILQSLNGTFTIKGNVFSDASGITLGGNGNSFTFTDGNVIAKGGIKVLNGAKLVFTGSDKELWTDEITLGSSISGGAIELKGKIYVADDLIFTGQNSSAKLEGEYYGFGSGTNSNESSAILINARNSSLNMSGLDRLSLAGLSYIEISSDNGLTNNGQAFTSPIIMGESISTMPDQLAYLLPPECMTNYYTNPCILEDDPKNAGAKIKPAFQENTVIWTINGVERTLQYYLGSGHEKGNVLSLYSQGDAFAYVFIVFTDRTAANEYFKDYFTTYPDRIEQYADLYLTYLSPKAGKVSAAGNTFYSADGSKLSLYPADTAVLTGNMSTRYKNKISPLDKFIYRDKLNELTSISTPLYFFDSGKKVAVISNTNYEFTNADSDVQIIVAKGNVTISYDFKGIIIAGGTVTVNRNIEAAPIDPNILDAVATDSSGNSYTLSDFVRGSAGGSTENVWDISKLVVYDNWKKN